MQTKKTRKKNRSNIVELPGVEGPGVSPTSIPEIDTLCDDYVKERDKRMKMTPREVAAKSKLIDAIQRHREKIGTAPDGSMTYRYDGQIITVEPGKVKLKVKTEKVDGEEE